MLTARSGFSTLAIKLLSILILTLGGQHSAEALSVQTTTKVETTVNELLRQAPNYDPSEDGDFLKTLGARMPRRIQYFMRDSGVSRFLVDSLTLVTAVPVILAEQPTALTRFLHLSGLQGSLISKLVHRQLKSDDFRNDLKPVKFRRLQYAKDRRQVLDLIQCEAESNANTNSSVASERLVLFVHGGAWGSGFPAIYRLIAGPFLNEKIDVSFLGYRTYPTGNVPDQAADIVTSVSKLKQEGLIDSKTEITLVGHSSGSHIAAMALLENPEFRQRIDSFVAMSGVYDVPKHYLHERTRSVERLSPMAPASVPSTKESPYNEQRRSLREDWKSQSPTWLLRNPSKLPLIDCFPDTLIIHGQNDTTVPMESSIRLWESLIQSTATQENTCRIDLEVLPEVDHVDTVTQIMFGGTTRETVLKWMLESE